MLKFSFLKIMLCFVVLSVTACASPAPVLFTVITGAGIASNVYTSQDEVENLEEAKNRTVADVKKGFSGEVSEDGRYGPVYKVND